MLTTLQCKVRLFKMTLAIPATMRAAYRTRYVPPARLAVERIATPAPKADEMVVRVVCATVNRTDTAVLTGKPFVMRFFTGLRRPRIPVTGTDFAGEVVHAPDGSEFSVGDRVYGFYDEGLGSHGEYVAVPPAKRSVMKIPDTVSYQDAAASLEGAHYAMSFLRFVDVKEGTRVVVNGGTGAIGSALIQLLKYRGAFVVATGPTHALERVSSLGADKVIDYQRDEFTDVGGRFEAVFDAVGKSSFGRCKKLLSGKGVYISSELGPRAQNLYLPLWTKIWGGRRVHFPIPLNIRSTMTAMRKLLAAGAFRPMIDRSFSLDQVGSAFDYVLSGKKIGNVLLDIQS